MNIIIDYDGVTLNGAVVLRPSSISVERWYQLWSMFEDMLEWDGDTWDSVAQTLAEEAE